MLYPFFFQRRRLKNTQIWYLQQVHSCKNLFGAGRRQTKIETFSSTELFIGKTFPCLFLRNINSNEILLIYHSNQILKSRKVGIDQSPKIIYLITRISSGSSFNTNGNQANTIKGDTCMTSTFDFEGRGVGGMLRQK